MPKALVVRTAGTNCEVELLRAFALAGATPELVHVDAVLADPAVLDAADLIALPGGFSYGDDIASGRILAVKLRERVYPRLRAAAERGCPILGVCNGFQVLVQAGLLPGPGAGEAWPEVAPEPTLTLTDNASARFVDDWVGVEAVEGSPCIWTAPLVEMAQQHGADEVLILPVAHGEGRFVAKDQATLAALEADGQVALRSRTDINGSQGAVAGVCDTTGRIFGLMPHPERYLDWNRHPWWTRLPAGVKRGETPGLAMFKAAVEAVADVKA
ncbi:MAG: phosphoribosylformylglycinamidine synthase subunit PurQ [Planctomycetota bacterium]|nr:phosphoribosylformylglycinamidine synthase subunit PurQ [Planctomycetota bacterium]